MRTDYRELPRAFAFMTSMPPPSLRVYIVEASEPDWSGHQERVQEVYTNLIIPSQDRFTISPEHRFHPDKYKTNLLLNSSDRHGRGIYPMEWWFTGFMIQNTTRRRDLHDIPLLDFDSRLLQDLLFEQSRPITLTNGNSAENIYSSVLQNRLNILSLFPRDTEQFTYHYNTQAIGRRRLSFSLRDLYPPQTPDRSERTRRRRDEDDDVDFFHPRNEYHPNILHEIPRSPRQQVHQILARPNRNRVVEPAAPSTTPVSFSLPKFVAEAMIRTHIANEKACSITMTPFKDIQDITITSCYHCFDQEALTRWMIENQTCPECRNRVEGTCTYRNE
jgi:hypothetical protein